jgi:hypothetical protein
MRENAARHLRDPRQSQLQDNWMTDDIPSNGRAILDEASGMRPAQFTKRSACMRPLHEPGCRTGIPAPAIEPFPSNAPPHRKRCKRQRNADACDHDRDAAQVQRGDGGAERVASVAEEAVDAEGGSAFAIRDAVGDERDEGGVRHPGAKAENDGCREEASEGGGASRAQPAPSPGGACREGASAVAPTGRRASRTPPGRRPRRAGKGRRRRLPR